MMQRASGRMRRLALPLVLLVLAIALVSAIGLRAQAPQAPAPAPAPPGPVQPIPYSHKVHVALGLQCRGCHTNPGAGKLMTYPPTALCLSCHQTVAADRPSIQKLKAMAEEAPEIPWVRVYKVADYVFWKHATHLDARITCAECHGRVEDRDVVAVETTIVRKIGCVSCHDKRQVYTDCGDCHEPRQSAAAIQPL
jgi:predicted CXXCH cytochrome family protein